MCMPDTPKPNKNIGTGTLANRALDSNRSVASARSGTSALQIPLDNGLGLGLGFSGQRGALSASATGDPLDNGGGTGFGAGGANLAFASPDMLRRAGTRRSNDIRIAAGTVDAANVLKGAKNYVGSEGPYQADAAFSASLGIAARTNNTPVAAPTQKKKGKR